MLVRCTITLVAAMALSSLSGCLLMDSLQATARQTKEIFEPDPTGYRDMTAEPTDRWQFVGKEGRGNRPRDEIPEPDWLRNIMTSEKTRNIERNLGFE